MSTFSNIAAVISIVISISAFYFSTRKFFWDSKDRVYNFINSIRYWKFDSEDIGRMQKANESRGDAFDNESYVAINVNNSTNYVINECMILFKPRNTMSWKNYCEDLIYQGVSDYILYTHQLSPMKNNLHRYVLVSQDIDKMDIALCVKDMSGKIWLKPIDGKLIRLQQGIYDEMLALEDEFSENVYVNQMVSKILKDAHQRVSELDQDFKVL